MDKKRAEEIASSPIMKKVTHLGTPVYINSVKDDGTAIVHNLGEHDKKYQVSLTDLFEGE